jgi:hypothetical protein
MYPKAHAKLSASPTTWQVAQGLTVASGCARTDSGFRYEYSILPSSAIRSLIKGKIRQIIPSTVGLPQLLFRSQHYRFAAAIPDLLGIEGFENYLT